jgi:putative transposase
VQPGKPEKREHEYIRHGVRALLASFVVPTGQLVWNLGQTRTSADWAAHLANVVQQLPAMQRYDWVVDNLNTHWSLDVCRLVAQWCHVPYLPKAWHRGVQRRAFLSDPTHQHVFHFTPKHGSWLNQVELWFSVLARRFLKRGDFASAHDFETRLCDYISMIQFFVLDVLLSRVVAVSTDPAPDSAFAPSFFGRPAGQLPSSHGTMSCVSRQAKIIHPFLSACASPIAWRRG